ncbi:glycosyltransferase family A protein [Massilia sp. CF038]|uniref:glycosyltransferase family 2 protein n=1 Tax=Massilia sp. CF038 TaxID=1881045 RepID=UPI0009135DED|nr:glycosyltransferase family A protein [Massilia sp. CF038]SHG39940.1 Glycosyl transferase family 2 [Massilia sp. CF038]
MQASISIVVPAQNMQRYIDQCLQSILSQLRPHHELIVVDDGSRDNTLARAFKAQEAYGGVNFHIFSQERAGMASARNHCLRVAQGDYIAFVDGDDVLLPGALAAMDQAIAAGAPDVLACDFRFWYPDDPARTRDVRLGYPVGKLLRESETILNTFFADRQMYIWSNVFRREIYARLPAPVFPPERMFEDVATVPRLLAQCASLVHLPHPVIDYRQHPGESAVSEQWCLDFAAALPVARRHLQACAVPDSVRRHFDIAAAYFYVGVVKNSYRLPRADGRRVRALIQPLFVGGLFNDWATLVAIAGSNGMISNDRTLDAVIVRQVESAFAGGLVRNFKRAASRKLRLWRRLGKAGVRAARGTAPHNRAPHFPT